MTTFINTKFFIFFFFASCFLCGCEKKEVSAIPSSPQEAIELTMGSLKNLDVTAFNEYTDNYVETYYNFLGGVEVEYRTFNELLQYQPRRGKRYQSAYQLSQKITQNLTWEIKDVREKHDTAEIDMHITNADIGKALECYEAKIMENVLEGSGLGLTQFMTDMSELVTSKETLISIIDDLDDEDIVSFDVTVSAYQENGQWKIHLSPEFINAFSGNMYDDGYSAETEQRMTELEDQSENLKDKIEKWAESWNEP